MKEFKWKKGDYYWKIKAPSLCEAQKSYNAIIGQQRDKK